MHWTIMGAAVLGGWAACMIWFCLVLVRRIRAAEVRAMPMLRWVGHAIADVFGLPAATAVADLPGRHAYLLPLALCLIALAVWTFAPRGLTRMAVPVALIGLGIAGLLRARSYARGEPWPWPSSYGFATGTGGSLGTYLELVLIQSYGFVIAGLWLACRRLDHNSWPGRVVLREPARRSGNRADRPRWGLLLIPLFGMVVELLGRTSWLDFYWWDATLTMAVGAAAVIAIIRWPAVAADAAVATLLLFGLYGLALAAGWPRHVPLPSPYNDVVRYGVVWVNSRSSSVLAGVEGAALVSFGLWLLPRALDDRTRTLMRSAADAELAGRVVRLTRTRADALDTAAAELRRVERDLHDGVQARLVALGMSLRAAERLIPVSPAAAACLVAEARETSLTVLGELRSLVRGICPPVLAERGLADALRALALDAPLRVNMDIDLPGRPDLPVETACYFAVAEALANVVKHSGAQQAHVSVKHSDGALRIAVTDDGQGGADPKRGSGLAGLERRLGTFDGVLAVSSPPGGPTIIAIEVPCALSSPKISIS